MWWFLSVTGGDPEIEGVPTGHRWRMEYFECVAHPAAFEERALRDIELYAAKRGRVMAATFQIIRTKKDGPDADYRIDAFESVDATTGQRYRDTIDSLLKSIDGGNINFVMVQGRRVRVIPKVHPRSGRRYVTTEGDGFPPNNLLNLPDCP